MSLIEKSIKYLINEVDGKKITFASHHPWRADGMHIVQHSLRVKSYIEEIKELEGIGLNDVDTVALPLAAILHDIGKLHGKAGHASTSIEMIQPFLQASNLEPIIIERINELIFNHSNKNERSDDLTMNLLIDADAIDEIGMQSIMMCSNWINRESAFFFVDLHNRLENKELEFIEKVLEILYFDSSKSLVDKKIQFIRLVTTQLKSENSGSINRETYEMLTEHNTTSDQRSTDNCYKNL